MTVVQIKPTLRNVRTQQEWVALQEDLNTAFQKHIYPFYKGTQELISFGRIRFVQWHWNNLSRELENGTRHGHHVIIASVPTFHHDGVEQVIKEFTQAEKKAAGHGGGVHQVWLNSKCWY
ncbi:unnamed protein product [Effrenium voratum]|nr:unnamed protein product [Effrenium voratum]